MAFAEGLMKGMQMKYYMERMNEQKLENEQKKKLSDIVGKSFQGWQADSKDSLMTNPDYKLANIIPKPLSVQERATRALMPDLAPVEQPNTSPLAGIQKGLTKNELMAKYPELYSLAGVKTDALPWGIRSGNENKLASLIQGKMVMSADQQAKEDRLRNFGIMDRGQKGFESNVKFGTGAQLTPNLQTMMDNLGIGGYKFDMPKTNGYEVDKANSKIATDNALIGQRQSAEWRNYNKPLVGPGKSGSGKVATDKTEKTRDALEKKVLILERQEANWVAAETRRNYGEEPDITKSPYRKEIDHYNGKLQALEKPAETANPQDGGADTTSAEYDQKMSDAIAAGKITPEQARQIRAADGMPNDASYWG
jgi:hypothetical protein